MKLKNAPPTDQTNKIRTSRRQYNHNVILLKIDFHTETIQTKERKIITTKGYKEYRKNIEQLQISKLIATGQNSYDKWCEAVEQSIKRVTKKQSKTNTRRDITRLMKMKKNLRKELNQSNDTKKSNILKTELE